MIPRTAPAHGIVTAEPEFTTTMVFGLAAATFVIIVLSLAARSMLDRSLPSPSLLPTTTMATLAARALVTAVVALLVYVTVTPLPARLWMPCNGVTVDDGLTPA